MITILMKNGVSCYVITKDHRVDWDHSKIVTFETDFTKRRFLESFFIHNSESAITDKKIVFILKFITIWRNLQLVITVFTFKPFVLPFSFDCLARYL